MLTSQKCCTCQIEKKFHFFHKSINALHGFARVCKECVHKAYLKNQIHYQEKARQWKKNNPEKRLINNRQWRANNLVQARKSALDWCKRNPEYGRFRRSLKRSATPFWADLNKIKEIYLSCPSGFHVDHIIPLNGKYVSGLHVETNLQYLPAKENLSKGNKFDNIKCCSS